MKLLRRKIDNYLKEWKSDKERMPLIVKGARQVGKTASILQFAHDNYQNVVAINFVLQQKYKAIFEEGYEVDSIIRNLTLINPSLKIEAGNTHLLRRDAGLSCLRHQSESLQDRWQVRCYLLWFAYGYQLSRDRIEQRGI